MSEPPPDKETLIDHSELDELLSGQDVEKPLTGSDPDEPIVDPMSDKSAGVRETVDQTDVDSLIGRVQAAPAAERKPATTPSTSAEARPIAVPSEARQRVGAENVAAAAPAREAEEALLSPELLENLVKEAKTAESSKDKVPEQKPPASPPEIEIPSPEELAKPPAAPPPPLEHAEEMPPDASPETPPAPGRYRAPLFSFPKLGKGLALAKMGISLISGLIAATCTFYALSHYASKPVRPPAGKAQVAHRDELQVAIAFAHECMDLGKLQEAVDALSEAISKASEENPSLPEAEFLRLSAQYEGLSDSTDQAELEPLQVSIDRLVSKYPADERVADAMHLKAKLYERTGLPDAAYSMYKRLIESRAGAPSEDEILRNAARLALKLGRGLEAEQFALRIVQKAPPSPLASDARVIIGDAYFQQGRRMEARRLFEDVAFTQPDTRAGAQAFARLGRIAIDEGRFDEAIAQLERRLETAKTVGGNDEVYLLLAQAYRQTGQIEKAERVLRDLIAFFPDTEKMPLAYVELAEVLEQLGRRREAIRLAAQAAQRYPNNPAAMRNAARFLSLDGDTAGAAEALVAADKAGAGDPNALLEAARYYRQSGQLDQALGVYDRLSVYFPTTPQAFDGRVEMAKTLYDQGKIRKAIRHLEDLSVLTEGKPEHLPVLAALGELYDDMGMGSAASGAFATVSMITTEPELLARSAVALLKNRAWDEGLNVASRVDTTKLKDVTAYRFLCEYGRAMLRADPTRGIELLERAYEMYPEQRSPEYNRYLLDAYLASDRSARARAIVMELEARVRAKPADAPLLRSAALAWADYLYERRDFRSAAEAYATAAQGSDEADTTTQWAKYQRAGALLQAEDLSGCVPLLDEIGASTSPWASQARLKAAYARLEQRLRGEVPTPPAKIATGG